MPQVHAIDTFTSTDLKGNPTTVYVMEKELSDSGMLLIAQNINFPVTAFLSPNMSYEIYRIKYFTVLCEIPPCGHAILAAAKVLFDLFGRETIKINSISGISGRRSCLC